MTRRIMVAKTTDAPANGEIPIYDSATDSWSNTDSPSVANLTTAQGIAFPATQNPSAGANVLDDYEENTWSPVYASSNGGTATMATSEGRYQKVGNRVTVSGVTSGRLGSLVAGGLRIDGLPFAASSAISYWAGWTSAHNGWVNMLTYHPLWVYVPAGAQYLQIDTTTNAAGTITSGAMATASLPAGSDAILIFGCSYEV